MPDTAPLSSVNRKTTWSCHKTMSSSAPNSLLPKQVPTTEIIQAIETYVLTAYTSVSQHATASPSLVSTAALPPCQHAPFGLRLSARYGLRPPLVSTAALPPCKHASAFQASLSAHPAAASPFSHAKNRSQGKPCPELADAARDDFLTSGGPKGRNVLTSEGRRPDAC